MVNSTVSSNFAKAISFSFLTASSRLYLRAGSIFSNAARYFFPCFFMYQLRGANERLALPLFSASRLTCDFSALTRAQDNRLALLSLPFDRQTHLPGSALDSANSAL